MGVIGFSEELATKVSPSRMFNAGVVDLHKLAPQLVSEVVSSAGIVQGDGGVGTIRQFTFIDAFPYGTVKERIDVLDKTNFEYKYTLVEGGDLGKKLQAASYHFKLVPSDDGGCLCKVSAEFHTLPGVKYTEDKLKVEKEETLGMFKAVEEYLLANPTAYA